MSELDQFPDVPVKDRNPVEAERKHAIAINRLRAVAASLDGWILVLGRIAVEQGLFSMETDTVVSNDVHITDWDVADVVAQNYSTMLVDPAAGTAQVTEPGLYRVAVNTVGIPLGGNNVEYFIGYQKRSGTWGTSLALGSGFVTSQTGAVSLGGWDFVQMAAGEAVRFVIWATTGTTLIYDTDYIVAQFSLVLSASEQQTAMRGLPVVNSNLHFRGDT